MTKEKLAEQYIAEKGFGSDFNNITSYEANKEIEQAFLAGYTKCLVTEAKTLLDEWCRGDDPCPHLKKRDDRLTNAKDIINDLVHLGEFNEHTDEEYFNYQVHEALKNAEQFLKEVEE